MSASMRPREHGRLLVLGIYFADERNAVDEIVSEIDRSRAWSVDQRWIAFGKAPQQGRVAAVTVDRLARAEPKFVILNRALAHVKLEDYAFVMVCDDDVVLPAGFVDEYLGLVSEFDFALCQPARTHDSYIDHAFVEQLDGLAARWTRFVEIGPLFSMRRDALALLVPFDEQSPMGWGYDFVWPHRLESAGLRLGIIDRVPVAHSIRKPVAHYEHAAADEQMKRYLSARPHLPRDEAFFIVEAYA